MNKTLVFIGDTHSQHQKLEAALTWCVKQFGSCYYCYLGDIFDPRLDNHEKNYPPYSDSRTTYKLVEDTIKCDEGIVLQSNHQDKLRRWLHHELYNSDKKNPVVVNYGLDYTLSQFVDPMTIEEKKDLYCWLDSLPYHVVLQSYDLLHDCEVSFLCSHAYFNTAASLTDPSEKHKQEALYGVCNEGNHRIDWWSKDNPPSFYGSTQESVRIAGHYHVVHRGLYNRVLDGGCGSTGGYLCVHVPAYGLYQEF